MLTLLHSLSIRPDIVMQILASNTSSIATAQRHGEASRACGRGTAAAEVACARKHSGLCSRGSNPAGLCVRSLRASKPACMLARVHLYLTTLRDSWYPDIQCSTQQFKRSHFPTHPTSPDRRQRCGHHLRHPCHQATFTLLSIFHGSKQARLFAVTPVFNSLMDEQRPNLLHKVVPHAHCHSLPVCCHGDPEQQPVSNLYSPPPAYQFKEFAPGTWLRRRDMILIIWRKVLLLICGLHQSPKMYYTLDTAHISTRL